MLKVIALRIHPPLYSWVRPWPCRLTRCITDFSVHVLPLYLTQTGSPSVLNQLSVMDTIELLQLTIYLLSEYIDFTN